MSNDDHSSLWDAPLPQLPTEQQKLDAPGTTTCLRCGTMMILCKIFSGFVLAPSGKPKLFGNRYISEAVALVCLKCGYTELRALNPEQLQPYE